MGEFEVPNQKLDPVDMAKNPSLGLPGVVSDDYVYRLVDLVNSDFRMPESDKDFTLSTEQLCKVSKILLYKLNLISKKNEYERGELASMINEKVGQIEQLTKSSLEEVNTFLHTVHHDFESFLQKHKREHAELNIKVNKTADDVGRLLHSTNVTVANVEQFATVLSCLVEFNAIE